jgi:hypothetical protein
VVALAVVALAVVALAVVANLFIDEVPLRQRSGNELTRHLERTGAAGEVSAGWSSTRRPWAGERLPVGPAAA